MFLTYPSGRLMIGGVQDAELFGFVH
jgi:hypothetical protein